MTLVSGDYGRIAREVTEQMGDSADWFKTTSVWRKRVSIIRVPYVLHDDALSFFLSFFLVLFLPPILKPKAKPKAKPRGDRIIRRGRESHEPIKNQDRNTLISLNSSRKIRLCMLVRLPYTLNALGYNF